MNGPDFSPDTLFAELLRRIADTAAIPERAAQALAEEIFRLASARLVLLLPVRAAAPAVVPEHRRGLLEDPACADLLRRAGDVAAATSFAADAAMTAILAPDDSACCLAVPLFVGDDRTGTLVVFGGEDPNPLVEMLAPVLALVLRLAFPVRRSGPCTAQALELEQTVRALRESEARFEELVRRSPVPLGLYDAQGNVTLVNDRLTATYGYTREDVPHMSRFWPLAFPDPAARAEAQGRWMAAVDEAQRLGSPDIAPGDYLITCKDGTVRVTEAFGTRIGDATLAVLSDVTALRWDEARLEDYRFSLEKLVDERTRELRLRQERLEVALEATKTALWQWNPTTREIYFSPTYYTMLGYQVDEFAPDQETWPALVHPEDWPAMYETLRDIAYSPRDVAFSHEFRMRGKRGEWRWILTRGNIVERDRLGRVCRVVGVHNDITERREEEKRLRMAMQALETTRECVYWIDQNGFMLYVNPATEQELGYSAAELRHMTIADIDPNTPAELWGPEGELTRRLLDEGLRKFPTLHRHRDGRLIPVEVDSDPFRFDGQTLFIAIARDISGRLAAEDAVRKSEAKFAALFSLTPDPMALVRMRDGVIMEVSRSLGEFFGYPPDKIIGRSVLAGGLDVGFDAEHRRRWTDLLQRDGEALCFETQLCRGDGSLATVLISGKVVEIGGERCVIVDLHDVTEQKRHADHLERIAHHDPLTGLPNRLLLGDRLRQAIAQNQRAGSRIAVCYLDLDGFKEVNDRFGHQVGDQLLVEVAARLAACVRGGDTVARLGGDEFVVLLSGLASDEECRIALERLLQSVSTPYTVGGGRQEGISASIGVTLFPNDPFDPDTLVRHADHAMYAAKQAGKNRYQLFDTRLEQRIEARHATLRRVAEALESGQFRLHYQPKVDCRQGRVVGAEALIRWQHPTLGLLSPAEFIPLIEDTDLALAVGEWVIRQALSQAAQWRREGIGLCLSVNAFIRQLLDPGFVGALAAILGEHPESGPDCLQIEIVETAALKELDALCAVIEDCRTLGVTFSLDDFGTGYSTLAHLRHLPATEIKIDQSFVRHMLTRAEDFAIVEAVIGLGRAFGRSIVAEGAETPAHIERLLALGCDVMQGYALARPMAAEDFSRWIRAFRPDPAWQSPAGGGRGA